MKLKLFMKNFGIAILILMSSYGNWGWAIPEKSDWSRDPFYLPFSKENISKNALLDHCPSQLKLEGTLTAKSGDAQAFINGKIYAIGEKISGYTIQKIGKNSVHLLSHKYRCQLKNKD